MAAAGAAGGGARGAGEGEAGTDGTTAQPQACPESLGQMHVILLSLVSPTSVPPENRLFAFAHLGVAYATAMCKRLDWVQAGTS